jgi:hypothetical protein
MARAFGEALGPAPSVSMAALQGCLMRFKRDPAGAVAAAGKLVEGAGKGGSRGG